MQIIRHKKSESITETFHLPPQFWGASWTSLLLECILWHCLGCVLPGTWNLFSTKEKKKFFTTILEEFDHIHILSILKSEMREKIEQYCVYWFVFVWICMHVKCIQWFENKIFSWFSENACFFFLLIFMIIHVIYQVRFH